MKYWARANEGIRRPDETPGCKGKEGLLHHALAFLLYPKGGARVRSVCWGSTGTVSPHVELSIVPQYPHPSLVPTQQLMALGPRCVFAGGWKDGPARCLHLGSAGGLAPETRWGTTDCSRLSLWRERLKVSPRQTDALFLLSPWAWAPVPLVSNFHETHFPYDVSIYKTLLFLRKLESDDFTTR